MTKHEEYACGHYLALYPPTLSFEEVLDLVEKESTQVLIWSPFAAFSGTDVVTLMKEMRDTLVETFPA